MRKHADILTKYDSYSNLVALPCPNRANIHLKLAIFLNIKLKKLALQVLMSFVYVNCYLVLHNVTYVAKHLYLMNLYRIQICADNCPNDLWECIVSVNF